MLGCEVIPVDTALAACVRFYGCQSYQVLKQLPRCVFPRLQAYALLPQALQDQKGSGITLLEEGDSKSPRKGLRSGQTFTLNGSNTLPTAKQLPPRCNGKQQGPPRLTERNWTCWVALGDPKTRQGPADVVWKVCGGYARFATVKGHCAILARREREPRTIPLARSCSSVGFCPCTEQRLLLS